MVPATLNHSSIVLQTRQAPWVSRFCKCWLFAVENSFLPTPSIHLSLPSSDSFSGNRPEAYSSRTYFTLLPPLIVFCFWIPLFKYLSQPDFYYHSGVQVSLPSWRPFQGHATVLFIFVSLLHLAQGVNHNWHGRVSIEWNCCAKASFKRGKSGRTVTASLRRRQWTEKPPASMRTLTQEHSSSSDVGSWHLRGAVDSRKRAM